MKENHLKHTKWRGREIMKKVLLVVVLILTAISLTGCTTAETVSNNLSEDADQFKILRKVIFYNVITGEYMHVIEGFCSIEADTIDEQLEVTCKIAEGEYIKDYLGLSDNTAYMVLQVDPANVSPYHYKVYLRPETLIPDIEIDLEE